MEGVMTPASPNEKGPDVSVRPLPDYAAFERAARLRSFGSR